jgi:hypothetical protein
MEGWRQERLGSRAGTHREGEKNKNILTGKGKKETYVTLTRLLMEGLSLFRRRFAGRTYDPGYHRKFLSLGLVSPSPSPQPHQAFYRYAGQDSARQCATSNPYLHPLHTWDKGRQAIVGASGL